MPAYEWYGEHLPEQGLDQGLILPDFPVPDYGEVDYDLLASDEDVSLPVEIKKADLIVMTQACDLQSSKVKNVTLCRVYALNEYLLEAEFSLTKAKEFIGNLESNKFLNMTLLDKPNFNPYGGAFEDYLLVKFDESVNYPIKLLEQRLQSQQGPMMKLQPPYRESLSQNYGLFFMRVGNPEDRQKIWIDWYKDFLVPPTA